MTKHGMANWERCSKMPTHKMRLMCELVTDTGDIVYLWSCPDLPYMHYMQRLSDAGEQWFGDNWNRDEQKVPALVGVHSTCQICHRPFSEDGHYYDFKTRAGPWAYACTSCFFNMGGELGVGTGQKYALDGTKLAG